MPTLRRTYKGRRSLRRPIRRRRVRKTRSRMRMRKTRRTSIPNRIHKFVFPHGTNEPQNFGNAGTTTLQMTLSALLTANQITFIQQFEEYRLLGYSYSYKPFFNMVGGGADTLGPSTCPVFRYHNNRNADLDFQNEALWDAIPNIQFRQPWKPFSFYFKCKPAAKITNSKGSGSTDVMMSRSPWISSADTDFWYGESLTKQDGVANSAYTFIAKQNVYIECRKPRVITPIIP
ncbi:MAG: hypothetical protein [Circoviridae sp.]|nr:MAG: hypothetical protein [Circoviridae sp.]